MNIMGVWRESGDTTSATKLHRLNSSVHVDSSPSVCQRCLSSVCGRFPTLQHFLQALVLPHAVLCCLCTATVVSALFTAPAQKKRKQDGAAAALPEGSTAGPASASSAGAAHNGGGVGAEDEGPSAKPCAAGAARPAVQTAANGALGSTHAGAHSRSANGSGAAFGPVRDHSAAEEATPDGQHTAAAADDAADRSEAGGGGTASEDDFAMERDRMLAARRPFAPEHYVATIAELEVHEFPLPAAGADGELVCPPGYVATRRRGVRRGKKPRVLGCTLCLRTLISALPKPRLDPDLTLTLLWWRMGPITTKTSDV